MDKTSKGKGKKHSKLDRAWSGMLIDLVIGPHMMMLGMREPASAEKLLGIFLKMLGDLYSQPDKWKNDPKQFVPIASNALITLFNSYMQAKMASYLKEGMPKRPMIIQPVRTGKGRMQ